MLRLWVAKIYQVEITIGVSIVAIMNWLCARRWRKIASECSNFKRILSSQLKSIKMSQSPRVQPLPVAISVLQRSRSRTSSKVTTKNLRSSGPLKMVVKEEATSIIKHPNWIMLIKQHRKTYRPLLSKSNSSQQMLRSTHRSNITHNRHSNQDTNQRKFHKSRCMLRIKRSKLCPTNMRIITPHRREAWSTRLKRWIDITKQRRRDPHCPTNIFKLHLGLNRNKETAHHSSTSSSFSNFKCHSIHYLHIMLTLRRLTSFLRTISRLSRCGI